MKTEICVPVGALAKGEEATAPGPGDSVEFSGMGTVSRVEGDNAYITVETVNGEPVMDDSMHKGEGQGEGEGEGDMDSYVRGERAREEMP